jgi:hypothetical protein
MSFTNTEHTHRMVSRISETEYALGMVPWIAETNYVDILTALLKKALIRRTQIRIWQSYNILPIIKQISEKEDQNYFESAECNVIKYSYLPHIHYITHIYQLNSNVLKNTQQQDKISCAWFKWTHKK